MQSWRWLVKSDYYLHTHLDSGFFIQIEKEESEHFYKDFYCGENVFCNPKHFYRGRFDFQQPKIANPMVDVLGKRLFFRTLKFIGHLCLFFIFQAGLCNTLCIAPNKGFCKSLYWELRKSFFHGLSWGIRIHSLKILY